jgi:arylsulfatase A-like enzyme
VSLSTTDAVGHRYGPDSKELHDHVIQLDRFLGAFLDSLFAMRDSNSVVIALTADHGMMPFPTLKSRVEPNDGAQRVDLAPVFAMTRDRLALAQRADTLVTFADNILSLQKLALAARGLRADSIAESFARDAMRVQGVLRADFVSRLAATDTVNDAIARRWLHVFSPASDTTRLVVTLTPHSYNSTVTYATHGSPHDGDAHVPLVLRGPGIKAGRVTSFVRVVDLAPTLAELLGVKPGEPLDGRALRAALP